MNKRFNYISILSITVIVYCVSLYVSTKKEKEQMEKALEEKCFLLEETLFHQVLMQSQQEGIIKNGKAFMLKQKNPYTLLYYYYGGGCQSCIDDDLQLLRDCKKNIGKESIVVISLQSNIRNYKIRARTLFKDFNVVHLSEQDVYIPKDSNGMVCRCFALMDSTNQISNIFFPYLDKSVTSAYLKRLCYNYW